MIKAIGIRREDKNKWERRVPLIPEDLSQILKSRPGSSLVVQPSPIRVYPDTAFSAIGATLQDDLSACDLVIGVKEMPLSLFQPGKVYAFFSHTLKGQSHNMPMLKRILEKGCTLIDYERIVDEKGRRLVFFGRYAGLAGMIDTLWALGKRFLEEGLQNPFTKIQPAHVYKNLEEAKEVIQSVGREIRTNGLPKNIPPVIVGFTGYGNVSKGAQEIFDLLPNQDLLPDEILAGKGRTLQKSALGKVVFYEKDTVKSKTAGKPFELADYFRNPGSYESTFRRYADFLTVLVNCIYWTPESPKLLTKRDAADIWAPNATPSLKVIGDISCDIHGGIEFTLKETSPDDPLFTFDPVSQSIQSGVKGHGPVVMAVDNLPCELPLESSQGFSHALKPFISSLFDLDLSVSFSECKLAEPLKKATIAWKGELTPDFHYLKSHLSSQQIQKQG